MARIRISDMTPGTLPVVGTTLLEVAVANPGSPSGTGYDTRRYAVADLLSVATVQAGTGLSLDTGTSPDTLSLANTGVAPGTYQGLTVDQQGRITGATNQGYLSGTVPIASGGTGQTTAGAAFNAIAAAGGTVGGNLTVSGNITASGGIKVNNNPNDALFADASYTSIAAPDGSSGTRSIFLGSVAAGGVTYYRNTGHTFQDGTGGATFCNFNSGGLTFNGTVTINGGATAVPFAMNSTGGNDCTQSWTVIGTRFWITGIKANGDYTLYDATAAAGRMSITTTGACWASSTWGVISDMRLKEASSIQEYPRGLKECLALDPIAYQHNGKGGVPKDGEWKFGLSAQQVQEVLPELIREHEFVPPEGSGEEPMTVLTYSPTDIVFSLIGAVKEIAARLDTIEAALPPVDQRSTVATPHKH